MLYVVSKVCIDTSWSLLACAPISKSNNLIHKYMDGQSLASSFITVLLTNTIKKSCTLID